MKVIVDVPYEVDEEIVLTPQDLHLNGNCNRGSRKIFQSRGWNWSKFVTEGLKTKDFGVFDENIRGPYENALKRLGR